MKQGIIYGGAFLFVFVIVTGLIIYLSSTYENIFQLDFAPKSVLHLSDSTKTDSLKVVENNQPLPEPDSTIVQDSVLLSSLSSVEIKDSTHTNQNYNENVKNQSEKLNPKKESKITDANNLKSDITTNQPSNTAPETQKEVQGNGYAEWVKKVTSIYSSMEPKKAAKIIQTYSDNVARDILYNMKKKTAAKVVSELSPETANRIFRFE
ncbi:MAG: hypothetical protein Q8M94_04215 [Ignavibacteria bacterium]|nr:hypothetical protein [Ignavibacteria bacterium]